VSRLALVLVLVLAVGVARADDERPLITYVVTETTSCDRLAAKLWGDRDKFTWIHDHNELGPLPHHHRPGTRLVIPVVGPIAPDATVSRTEGTVDARSPRERDWSPAAVGTRLYRAWRVYSRAQSSAEVIYRDASQIALRENTVVVIYGPSAGAARNAEAELESGALRSRLAELAGGAAPLVVRTESAESELEAGRAVIAALDGGRTTVSVHEGRPVKVRGRRAARPASAVSVDPGMGTDVARGQDPAPPRPLPATPEWQDGPALFVAADATAAWRPVAGAAGYRVELARDDPGEAVIGQVTAGAGVTAYVGRGMPAGVYQLTVSALDAAGLEGRPSARRRLVVAAAALAPGMTAPTPGAVIVAPAGRGCAIDGGAARERLVLRDAGRVTLRCAEERAELEVAPLPLTLSPAPARPRAVLLAGPAALVEAVELRAPPGVTLARRGALAAVETLGAARVDAVLTVEGEAIVVGAIEVAAAPSPSPSPPGLAAGVLLRAAAYHGLVLGDNGVPEVAVVAGVRVSRALGARFAVEAELAAGTVQLAFGGAATAMYAARGLMRVGGGRARFLVGPGITLQEVFRSGEVSPAFRYGPHLLGGVELDLGARWRLRADVQPWLSRADDDTGAATWFGAELAVRW
jgi:hypothetical protein